MAFCKKNLLTIRDLTKDDILSILDTADSLKEISTRKIKKVPTLRGRTIISMFFEPSTRTRTSFEIAGKRLSADMINFSGSTSSITKGENLVDTARNLEAMKPDILVIRHSCAGAPQLIAKHLQCSVINAGDGAHEHPTQALLDLLTIREHKKSLEGLKIVIIGDIAHSRVARSNIHAMKTMGMQITVAGPPTMIPTGIHRLGVSVCHNLIDAICKVDVIMMLRIQVERQSTSLVPSLREYSNLFGLTTEKLKNARPNVLIIHPGPVNRGIEISPEIMNSSHSLILDQVTNGVAVRMSLMYLLLGGNDEGFN